jgi:small conductance mechanosensitive channel
MLAVGATALLIFLLAGTEATGSPGGSVGPAPPGAAAPVAVAAPQEEGGPVEATGEGARTPEDDTAGLALDTSPESPSDGAREATGTLRELGVTLYNALPAVGIAVALLLVAGILARLIRMGLRAALSSWERAEAMAALVAILIWLLALGGALSVVAGDARALVGSIGLFGLALSWALQTPIESFTGWLLNSFRSYYRVGDRIAVGEVFGDVARIDFLTTSVFEAGGPDKQVRAAQSTGALITFPNAEILRSNVVNYTRDFPYVYDELTVAVANESEIPVAIQLVERVANQVVGERMAEAAETYAQLLRRARLAWDVTTGPQVYVAARDSWTDLTVRYVVPVREMRKWATRLQLALNEAFEEPEVADRVFAAYTRTQVQTLPPPGWAEAHTDKEQ